MCATPVEREPAFRADGRAAHIRKLSECQYVLHSQKPGDQAPDTPGVAAAPVALAGAIVPGVARFIVMLWAQADVFGVGITPVVGSMLVSASTATAG